MISISLKIDHHKMNLKCQNIKRFKTGQCSLLQNVNSTNIYVTLHRLALYTLEFVIHFTFIFTVDL